MVGLLIGLTMTAAWTDLARAEPLRLQLGWSHQAQYAGYYVAEARGFYQREGAVFDTVGLSAFAVVGAKVALGAGLGWHWVAICAALTAAGGGMMLDVVTGREPRTFQGEPYEEVAIAAGILLYLQLQIASRYEHAPWMVTAAILLTLVAAFAGRLSIIALGIRSYRLEGRPVPSAGPR